MSPSFEQPSQDGLSLDRFYRCTSIPEFQTEENESENCGPCSSLQLVKLLSYKKIRNGLSRCTVGPKKLEIPETC